MKIKKPVSVTAPGGETAATGGATIAARFQLDNIQGSKKKGATVGKTAATFAFSAGLLALVLAVGLAGMLYKHWEYMASI